MFGFSLYTRVWKTHQASLIDIAGMPTLAANPQDTYSHSHSPPGRYGIQRSEQAVQVDIAQAIAEFQWGQKNPKFRASTVENILKRNRAARADQGLQRNHCPFLLQQTCAATDFPRFLLFACLFVWLLACLLIGWFVCLIVCLFSKKIASCWSCCCEGN